MSGCIRLWGYRPSQFMFVMRCWLPGEEHEAEPDGPRIALEWVWEEPQYFIDYFGISPDLIERVVGKR